MRRAATTLLALIALAAPASAGAAEPTGSALLVLGPAKARALEQRGVEVEGVGAADTRGRQIRFEVAGGSIGTETARLVNSGGLRFVAGEGRARRDVKLSAIRVRLGGHSTLSAELGGRRRAIFDLRAQSDALAIDASRGTAQLHKARLVWRRSALRAVDRLLGARMPRGPLGTLKVSAATPTPTGSTPKSGPVGDEPPLLARPASAVDVTAANVVWNVRDSWIRYVNTAMAPEPLEGAAAQPAIPENSHPCPDRPAGTNPTLVYSYSFPFVDGWYDPPTGTTALYQGGGVRFAYPSHGIDLTTRNPEIEINGSASRAILRINGAGDTANPDKRVALLSLGLTEAPKEGPAGTFTLAAPVRGSLTADGQAVFAGFYPPPNDGFGCFSISFTTG